MRGFLSGASRYSARIERTAYPAPATLQHMRVDHGRSDVLVPQEFLHGPNIVTILQQVRSQAVPVRLDIMLHLFADPGPVFGFAAGALDTGATHGRGRRRALVVVPPGGGKEPGGVSMGFPVGAEESEGSLGQGDVPVCGALAAVDMDLEARAIHIGNLQEEGFLASEAQALNGGAVDLMVEECRRLEDTSDFFNPEDSGEAVGGWRAQER